jgi:hypothetical protein
VLLQESFKRLPPFSGIGVPFHIHALADAAPVVTFTETEYPLENEKHGQTCRRKILQEFGGIG